MLAGIVLDIVGGGGGGTCQVPRRGVPVRCQVVGAGVGVP